MVDAVAGVAKARGVSMAEVGLAWLLARPGLTAPRAAQNELAAGGPVTKKKPKTTSAATSSAPTPIARQAREVGITANLRTVVESVWFGDAAAGNYDAPEYQEVMFKEVYGRHVCRLDPWPDPVARAFKHLNPQVYNTMQGPNERAMPSSISFQSQSLIVPAHFSAQYFQTSLPLPRTSPFQFPLSIGPAGK